MHNKLEKLRKRINKIDKKLKKNLRKREELIMKAAVIKKGLNLKIEDKKREREILKDIKSPFIKKIFKEIIQISKILQSRL